MPTTMNATATTGGTADAVVVLKEDDLALWEGQLKMRALPEILSGTLMVRYQVYAYSAFQAQRFLPSISILTGNTGLARRRIGDPWQGVHSPTGLGAAKPRRCCSWRRLGATPPPAKLLHTISVRVRPLGAAPWVRT